MTDTTEIAADGPVADGAGAPRGDLSALRLPQLQAVAAQLGISGTARMRKSDLIAAIQGRQNGGGDVPAAAGTTTTSGRSRRAAAPAGPPAPRSGPDPTGERQTPAVADVQAPAVPDVQAPAAVEPRVEAPAAPPADEVRTTRTRTRQPRSTETRSTETRNTETRNTETRTVEPSVTDVRTGEPAATGADATTSANATAVEAPERSEQRPPQQRDRSEESADSDVSSRRDGRRDGRRERQRDGQREPGRDQQVRDQQGRDQGRDGQREPGRDQQVRDPQGRDQGRDGQREPGRDPQGRDQFGRDQQRVADIGRDVQRDQRPDDDDDDDGRRGRRRGRFRDRKRGRNGREVATTGGTGLVTDEPEISDDDVLVPVAGILDVLDNYAFVRTSGYLPGPNDVYVSLSQVKRYGLRKGDAVVGAVRQLREGEQSPQQRQQKFNAIARIDTVNGAAPDEARTRPEFGKLTPLYPQERLRLETEPNVVATRLIDLVAPIGKGQRGLIVSPPKAGKTLILQAIANAITRNNPECHLMVVLVDERPEEVTDMQRTVKGEVIASTFDRPADDHTTVAELAIERAKRLVELGHDVVVLLDSITRLGRAYNLAAPASGRILSGGVDSSALYPPKRFFGAARNIENGGSLTILATALVETGSKMDEVIFEEFKGTGNMELRLSRQLADKRVFPAIDVNPSGTRREEILMSKEEINIVWKLRRVMGALDAQQAVELLLDRVKQTKSNAEFLMQVQKTSPVPGRDDD